MWFNCGKGLYFLLLTYHVVLHVINQFRILFHALLDFSPLYHIIKSLETAIPFNSNQLFILNTWTEMKN